MEVRKVKEAEGDHADGSQADRGQGGGGQVGGGQEGEGGEGEAEVRQAEVRLVDVGQKNGDHTGWVQSGRGQKAWSGRSDRPGQVGVRRDQVGHAGGVR